MIQAGLLKKGKEAKIIKALNGSSDVFLATQLVTSRYNLNLVLAQRAFEGKN
jgi:hypothetical protein